MPWSRRVPPGSSPRVHDGHHVTALANGPATLQPQRALRVSDIARAASITKTFVSTVTLQLAGERRPRLDDTVARWLPGGAAITIRELLNHTSGPVHHTDDEQLPERVPGEPDASVDAAGAAGRRGGSSAVVPAGHQIPSYVNLAVTDPRGHVTRTAACE